MDLCVECVYLTGIGVMIGHEYASGHDCAWCWWDGMGRGGLVSLSIFSLTYTPFLQVRTQLSPQGTAQ